LSLGKIVFEWRAEGGHSVTELVEKGAVRDNEEFEILIAVGAGIGEACGKDLVNVGLWDWSVALELSTAPAIEENVHHGKWLFHFTYLFS
jgi:hypothetical protein